MSGGLSFIKLNYSNGITKVSSIFSAEFDSVAEVSSSNGTVHRNQGVSSGIITEVGTRGHPQVKFLATVANYGDRGHGDDFSVRSINGEVEVNR